MSKLIPINKVFANPDKVAFERRIKNTELILIMFCLMHHLPFSLMDFLPDLLRKCCPDSKIAKHIACGRTKANLTVKNILGEKGRQNVANQLRQQNFSIIIDETTDISSAKALALVARIFDRNRGLTRDRFLGLLNLTKTDAASIFTTIVNHINNLNIPLSNIIGLGSDNASVMAGKFTGVQARFKEIIPNLFFMNCICHSLHLCASYACQQLPFAIEQLARDIFNFFAHSSKRCNDMQEFQQYFGVKPHKILGLAQTRWLSLEMVVNRILEQWDPLKFNFVSCTFEDKGTAKTARSLAEHLGNPINKLYFLFLSYSLRIVNKMNIEFQSEKIRIHALYETMETNYKLILSNFVNSNCLINVGNVNDIDFYREKNHLPLSEIFMGSAIQTFRLSNIIEEDKFLEVANKAKQFYIELAQQIKNRFEFNNLTLKSLSLINPENLFAANLTDMIHLLNAFPNLVANKQEKDEILDELKLLKVSSYALHLNKANIEEFWTKIATFKNSLDEPLFKKLSNFIIGLMSLPHSSAAAERIFRDLNITKTKKTNRLLLETIDSIMSAKELLSEEEKKSISSNKASEVWTPRPEHDLVN